ncbi:MAG: Na/Pi symporter, partial [Vicinamibacteria bacterium]
AGAGITALVQSSSATTLATIGFVSAGLLSLPNAIGVVIGANIGTTATGWLVSLLGLKLSIGKIAMPLIGVGALLRLLARERLAQAGLALAGFGVIFVGIDALQAGMAALAGRVDPAQFPVAGLAGRLLLVLLGVLMTVIMQSSSAAVATTLTALSGGAITLDQAAALVIGQNVGTTVTAA